MKRVFVVVIGLAVLIVSNQTQGIRALTQTQTGSVPVTAVVPGPPPTTPAVISSPTNNQHFTTTPLVVKGTCGPGLMVRVFDNNQLAGSVTCEPDGTFVMNITLDMGKNVLKALNYDTLNQAGPTSAVVTVYVDSPSTSGNSSSSDSGSIAQARPNNMPEQNFHPIQQFGVGTVLYIIDPQVHVNFWLNWILNVAIIVVLIWLICLVRKRIGQNKLQQP